MDNNQIETIPPDTPVSPEDFDYGSIYNSTTEKLLVYGDKKPGETKDNSLWVLDKEARTKIRFDCDGLFVPKDRKFVIGDTWHHGPVMIKYYDGQIAIIGQDGDQYVEKRVRPYGDSGKVYKKGELNWPFPEDTTSADIQKMDAEII
ncbi:hypothetical protein [Peribacillus simplex]|uniref:hypothetical protein n=1 Tax=Peribacillus simplex TaxID=1478 RepID=UPI003D034FDC